MPSTFEQRKLAAIMFTDMVGYTALSQRNEALALELLEEHRRILRSIFPRFNGTEIKTIGDAFLVEFQSALEAAQCALEIQRSLAKRNLEVSPERCIQLRIGIHVGDVVHREGDVYGDGVNIASRIQPVAGVGGICISVDVERQIHHALEARFEKLAPVELKNVEVPMELFQIVLPWEARSEIRRGGDQKSEVRRSSIHSARSTWAWTVVIVLLGIIGLGWWWTNHHVVGTSFRSEIRRGEDVRQVEAGRPGGPSLPIPEKSIAVLPFDNLSSDKENAYFAEGIQDEILTRLSKIAALKVISRTSTQKYKSAPDNLREIGQQLGVANLLEGSVQKIANAVHVNVQLIHASNDEHIWAESYNRKLDDVFGVEGEVAGAIAEQLNAKLSGAEEKAVTERPTQNAAAYDAYLRGLSIENTRDDSQADHDTATNYATAVQLDPAFALAWARLAAVRSGLYFSREDSAINTAASVKEAADRAMALQPELGEAWIAQGAYRYRVLRDFAGALQAYAEAAKRLPNNARLFQQIAFVERRLGRWDAAVTHYQEAVKLDPRNVPLLDSFATNLLQPLRRYAEEEAILDRALQIVPGNEQILQSKAFLFQNEGRLDQSARVLQQIDPNSKDDNVVSARTWQFLRERRFPEAVALLEPFTADTKAGNTDRLNLLVFLGCCQDWAGRSDEARTTFARGVEAIKPSADSVVPVDGFGTPYYLALCYAGLGDKEKALKAANQAVADYQDDAFSRPVAELVRASIQGRFGDLDSAIAALPHLLEVPAGLTISNLRFDPFWDPLRKDPRFQKLIQEPNK